jgi:hypothetical protein
MDDLVAIRTHVHRSTLDRGARFDVMLACHALAPEARTAVRVFFDEQPDGVPALYENFTRKRAAIVRGDADALLAIMGEEERTAGALSESAPEPH